jgi:hypothetical protein
LLVGAPVAQADSQDDRYLAALAGLRTPHRHAELFRAPLLKRTASRWARVSSS